jgi:D-sedoheptulose 7-phosphate isomerase
MIKAQKLERIKRQIDDSVLLRKSLASDLAEEIVNCSDLVAGVIGSGGKLMIAGNGEQAALASHFATELLIRCGSERMRQALPAIALSSDLSVVTAASNDFGQKEMFARQIEGLGHKNDMLVLLSFNGEEGNLIRAAQVARERGIITLGLIGNGGGKLRFGVDRPILIPHPSRHRVIEEQTFLIHLLVDLIESDLVT